MSTNFDEMWADALASFYATTDRRLDDKSLPLITTLDELKVELSRKEESFTEFRRKKHALYDGMSKALSPISMLANIAAGGLSNAFPPSVVAFNAFNYMIDAAGNVSASYDSVCDLLEEMARFTTRLTVHNRQEITPELRSIVIEILCAIIRLCGYAGRLMKHGRVTEYLKKIYLGKDKEIANEIAILQRLTETEARIVGALTLSTTTRTEKQVNNAVVVLSEVNVTVQDTNTGILHLRDQVSSLVVKMDELKNDSRSDVEEKQLAKIRLALAPSVTPEEIYRSMSGKRVPGTGDWVHDERLFKAWLDHEKPILWISGGPGAGKSYLSSNIIQLLTQIHPQRVQASSRISVAYYFCKDYDPALRSFNKALRTLAFQICQNDPVYAKYVAGIVSFPEDIKRTESLWQKLFVEFYSGNDLQSMVYMLIDGMDEAFEQERTTFLELLKSLQQTSISGGKLRIQILMVGRPELSYDIEQALEENLPTINISAIKNAADIQTYVNTKVSKERNLRRISKGLRDDIVTELTNRADGMFLWVDLMLRDVASKHKEIQMREALQQAPKGLFETIQHTLDRTRADLSEEDARDFQVLLSWVACSKRPFKLGELEDVLKLTSSEGEGVVYLEGELRKRYASFFNVNREDGRTTEDLQAEHLVVTADDDETSMTAGEVAVKLVNHDAGLTEDFGEAMDIDSDPRTTEINLSHASFGDFFRMHRAAKGSGTDWSMWNLRIVKHLLKMLCDKEMLKKWGSNSLSGYASCYWQDHLRDVDFDSVTEVDRLDIGRSLILMFRDKETVFIWAAYATLVNVFRQSWIYQDDNTKVTNTWLNAVSVPLTEERPEKILALLIDSLGKAWLQTTSLGWPENSFMVIKAYQDKMKTLKTNGIPPTATDYEATDLAHNSPDAILEVARSFGLEENSRWNARVGRVLREAGHYDTAAIYFGRAIDIAGPEDNSFLPYTGLARVYAAQERYSEAIEAAEKGLKFASDSASFTELDKTTVRNYWTTEMLKWHAEMKDRDSVVRLSQEIMKSFPDQYGSATRYIGTLIERKQYDTAMEVFRKASSEMLEEKGYTRLTAWTMSMMWQFREQAKIFDVLIPTCRAVGDMEFAKTTYLDAMKAVKKTDTHTVFLLEADYGKLLLQELKKPRQAAHIFEKILDDAKGSRANSPTQLAKVIAIDLLCRIYVARALHGGKDSKEASVNMEKLNKIWTRQLRSKSMPFFVDITAPTFEEDAFHTTKNTTLYLACLYRVFEQHEKARRLLKDHIQLGLDLLTNEDLDDDWQGYVKIADTLSRASDNTGALAAYALVAPKWLPEDTETPPKVPGSDNRVPIGSAAHSTYRCDGDCGTEAYWGLENFYCCKFCVDTCFCKDCYELVMEEKLGFNICGKDHEFLFVPAVEPFRKGTVPVGGDVMDQKEWLAKIRKEWDL